MCPPCPGGWGPWLFFGCLALHNALDGTEALGALPAQLRPARRLEVPIAPPSSMRWLCACGWAPRGSGGRKW